MQECQEGVPAVYGLQDCMLVLMLLPHCFKAKVKQVADVHADCPMTNHISGPCSWLSQLFHLVWQNSLLACKDSLLDPSASLAGAAMAVHPKPLS